jgi:Mrp family chromosome partitioning ATPase
LRALEREARTQRELLESYLAKYREASARDSINAAPPEARIISRATPALKPAYPKKLATVLIAAFAVFALSAGFTVTGALLSSTAAPHAYAYAPIFAPVRTTAEAGETAPGPEIASPPLAPVMGPTASTAATPLAAGTVEQIARDLRHAGDAGRRVTVVGTVRNVGTTYAAIMLARALARDANVVLVDLALASPNLSVISTDPMAPGIAELTRGTASFGDIITRDQYSNLHLVATGDIGNDSDALSSSPMLATVIEALARSYEYVVVDVGAATDVVAERIAPLAPRAVLVAADPASAVTRTVHERLLKAGFGDVTVVAGGAQAIAA